MELKTLEQVESEAKSEYRKSPVYDPKYESHFVLGYLQSAYSWLYWQAKSLEQSLQGRGVAELNPVPTEELNQSLSTLERLQEEFKNNKP